MSLSSSYKAVLEHVIPPEKARDWFNTYAETASKTVNVYEEFRVIGLDFLIHNRGAASLTVVIDGKTAKTVLAGDCFGINNTRFAEIAVTSAVDYDMVLAGNQIDELIE